ncbi:MAG: glycosyltransferase family 2 protein [Terriglobales bacterium]
MGGQTGTGVARAAAAPSIKIKSLRPTPLLEIRLAVVRLAVVLALISTVRYFAWRLVHTMNPLAKIFFWVFLVAEMLNFLEACLFYFIAWTPTRYATPAPLQWPTVDIYIATYNEPVELLRETIVCALNVRYPHKTYVLDDGCRESVSALCKELGADYIAREERDHAKAGNLNNALRLTQGEFIVTLDADHVPSPEFIDELVGFFADQDVAIVQTHQDFYNLDSFQHLLNVKKGYGWQQQELFFNVIQPGKDHWNAAFYCGSPAMIRRSALDDIGGFATGTITEDMHTGIKLQKNGWRVLYQNRTLARGLAPQTFVAFATQWQRWGQGAMQVLRKENPVFGPGMKLGQRICYFASFYFYWMSYQKLLYTLTPTVCLLTGVFPLLTDPATFVKFFGPYFVLNTFSSVMLQGGFRSFIYSEQFNILKMRVMMESIVGLFGGGNKFRVTPKTRSNAAAWEDVFLQLFIVSILGLATLVGFRRIMATPPGGYEFWALTINLFWSCFYIALVLPLIFRAFKRKEYRQTYRWPARLDLTLRYRMSGSGMNGSGMTENYARNLNRTGVSITTDKPFADGSTLDLELDLPARTIRAVGKVMRNQPYTFNNVTRYSNGIRFDQIAATDQDEISKYLFFEIAPREGTLLRLTHSTQNVEAHPEPGAHTAEVVEA